MPVNLTPEQVAEIEERYKAMPHIRFTTAEITRLWEQCRDDVALLLAQVEGLPRWTACVDKLPDNWGYYLVYLDGTCEMFVLSWRGDWIDNSLAHWSDVTHWMPLPGRPQ